MLGVDEMEKEPLPEFVSRENLAHVLWTQAWVPICDGHHISDALTAQHISQWSDNEEGQEARCYHLKRHLNRK